jgi:hypothetical protein
MKGNTMDSDSRAWFEEFCNTTQEIQDAIERLHARVKWEEYLEEGRKAEPTKKWKYDFGDELNE